MANLNSNKDKTCSIIDLIYNDIAYIGSYEDCCQFLEEQGDSHFLYTIRLNYGIERLFNRRTKS